MNMQNILIEPIEAFSDNYIWAIRNAKCAWLVDPGEYAPAAAYLKRHQLELAGILLTHHHGDHVGGVAQLREDCKAPLPVYGPRTENIAAVSRPLEEGDHAHLPELGVSFEVVEVPGHTRGHIAYFGAIGDVPRLFCGDTLFAAGCGRLFEGTAAQMWHSLSKLAALPDDTAVYCAHEYTLANLAFAHAAEPSNQAITERIAHARHLRARGAPTLPSNVGLEKATNPFLRAAQPALMASAQAFSGQTLLDAQGTFAVLRKWKDGFKAV
jgi:hydroxyacylglutathione hydrolase